MRTMRAKTVSMALFDRRLWLALSLLLAVIFCAATLPAFAEKVERVMSAIAFAEGGDPEDAQKILKKEE